MSPRPRWRLLVDESVSPLVAEKLRAQGYDAIAVREMNRVGASDEELVAWARANAPCAILTADRGFGQLFYLEGEASFGVIVLRPQVRSIASLFAEVQALQRSGILEDERIMRSLIIVRSGRIRWIHS